MLLGAVLAAIGIGVGFESAALPGPYGPAEARFRAAFPVSPTSQTITGTSAGFRRGWIYTGTSASAELSITALLLHPVTPGSAEAVLVAAPGRRMPRIPPRNERMTELSVGHQPATLVVGCLPHAPVGRYRCAGSLSVAPAGSPRIEWSAAAAGPSADLVEQLLASFAPAV